MADKNSDPVPRARGDPAYRSSVWGSYVAKLGYIIRNN